MKILSSLILCFHRIVENNDGWGSVSSDILRLLRDGRLQLLSYGGVGIYRHILFVFLLEKEKNVIFHYFRRPLFSYFFFLSIIQENHRTFGLNFETFWMQVEEGCQLSSVDDIARAVHHMIRIIEQDATALCWSIQITNMPLTFFFLTALVCMQLESMKKIVCFS